MVGINVSSVKGHSPMALVDAKMPTKMTAAPKKYGFVICEENPEKIQQVASRYLGLYNNGSSVDGEWRMFHAPGGQVPSKQDIDTFDGFWMFGSHASVLHDATWIRELEAFVQAVAEREAEGPRLVGICFSHQLFAKALGGKVGPNPSNEYVFKNETIVPGTALAAMGLRDPFNLAEAHGECVLELPRGAKSLAKSNTCEHEVVLFRNNIIGFQGHPDYSGLGMMKLVLPLLLESGVVPKEYTEEAQKSFEEPVHNGRVNELLIAFMTQV